MFRGLFKALALQWLFRRMMRPSAARRGPGWGWPGTRHPAPVPTNRPVARGSSLGRFVLIAIVVCVGVILFNKWREQPAKEQYEPDAPYVEPRGGW
jgi:hypothetical protein